MCTKIIGFRATKECNSSICLANQVAEGVLGMKFVTGLGLAAVAAAALSACSAPYGVLVTDQLLTQAGAGPQYQESLLCPDSDANADEAYSGAVRSSIGFADYTVLAGGRADLASCFGLEGFSSIKPDLAVTVGSGEDAFAVRTTGSVDTVLVVVTPSGERLFDDDNGEGTNAEISVSAPERGTYLVWIGTFSQDAAFSRRVGLEVETLDSAG